MSARRTEQSPYRILVVDDDKRMFEIFSRILERPQRVERPSRMIVPELPRNSTTLDLVEFALDFAETGQQAIRLCQEARDKGSPYCVAFVDVVLPVGFSGMETVVRVWQVDPDLQVVLCTGKADLDWEDVVYRLDSKDNLLVLKKPFDEVEVQQMAYTLTYKWFLSRRLKGKMADLENVVKNRTESLEQTCRKLKREMAEREKMETELRLAHKLESVGQLAAGIAHEINTPIQYVGDNTLFLKESFETFKGLLSHLLELAEKRLSGSAAGETFTRELRQMILDDDVDFALEESPLAVEQILEGVERISIIVKAMKEFSHPGSSEKTLVDINKGLQTSIEVSRNEWRCVADLETDFQPELPFVLGIPGDLNQVFLNLIVNAAQAIGEAQSSNGGGKGKIRVKTRLQDSGVCIEVSDNGPGIPVAIQDRIFDPFFTTKRVGKGTGHGLAIAHRVVEGHRGRLEVRSASDSGARFSMYLPLGDELLPEGNSAERD